LFHVPVSGLSERSTTTFGLPKRGTRLLPQQSRQFRVSRMRRDALRSPAREPWMLHEQNQHQKKDEQVVEEELLPRVCHRHMAQRFIHIRIQGLQEDNESLCELHSNSQETEIFKGFVSIALKECAHLIPKTSRQCIEVRNDQVTSGAGERGRYLQRLKSQRG
jgi:hypothetical protein